MITVVEQIIGLILGIGLGRLIWEAWEKFRNRFFLMSKEDKEKLKKLKKEKKKLVAELKDLKKFYKEYQYRFNQLPLLIVQNEYVITYEMFINHDPNLSKIDIIRLECSGKVLIKRMNLNNEITPEKLYNIICEKFKEDNK